MASCFVIAGCQTPAAGRSSVDAWSSSFSPRSSLDTPRLHLELLTPEHAALDYEAFMSSRERLHRTLHWGSWPRPEMTVEENRNDFRPHAREFADREAYAYSVLRPDRPAALGCVYLDPVDDDRSAVEVSLWVTEASAAAGLDDHLLRGTLRWIADAWPFESVVMHVHADNQRGIALARAMSLVRLDESRDDHVGVRWTR